MVYKSDLKWGKIPYAPHYNPWFEYFYPLFEDHFFVFKEFFQKIMSLCMVSIQERVMMARVWYVMLVHLDADASAFITLDLFPLTKMNKFT